MVKKNDDFNKKVFEITDKYKAAVLKKPIQDLLEVLYYELHRDKAINLFEQRQDYKNYQDSNGEWIEHELVGEAIKQSPLLRAMIHRSDHIK